jgi:3-hydroxyisobutyrate dehydrogenase
MNTPLLKKAPVIGWIGTGVMGQSMLGHILDKDYRCVVFTRTREKASVLLEKGATWCDSPAGIAEKADVIFTMVGLPADVQEVYLQTGGLVDLARPGTILVDMTTTSPSLAVEIYNKAKTCQVHALDAPVSGGDIGARNATLSIMAGGDEDTFRAIEPFFALMGKKIVYQGKAGSGQHTKMCNQIQIAGTMIGMCESLIYGYRAGLNLDTMLSSISGGAAACWSLDNLAPRILKRDFEPGFFVRHFIKDMGIALDEAGRMGLTLPGLALVQQLYQSLSALGFADKGTQALILALEQMADSRNPEA